MLSKVAWSLVAVVIGPQRGFAAQLIEGLDAVVGARFAFPHLPAAGRAKALEITEFAVAVFRIPIRSCRENAGTGGDYDPLERGVEIANPFLRIIWPGIKDGFLFQRETISRRRFRVLMRVSRSLHIDRKLQRAPIGDGIGISSGATGPVVTRTASFEIPDQHPVSQHVDAVDFPSEPNPSHPDLRCLH